MTSTMSLASLQGTYKRECRLARSVEGDGCSHAFCDLVIKGGITSGVVYPSAVETLARRYRLRDIGGASAGAIAAALTAAGEYGRQHGGGTGDLRGFEKVKEELGREGSS